LRWTKGAKGGWIYGLFEEIADIYFFLWTPLTRGFKMKTARRMNPSEPEKPDGNPDELSAKTSEQTSDKGVYFPEFVKKEDEEAFQPVDQRSRRSGQYLDLETTYVTKRIWEQKSLTVMNWRWLSDLEALTFAQFDGDLTIDLGEETEMDSELQMHLCWVLAEHRGKLFIFGSISLTPEAATALVQHPGRIMADLDNLDFSTANILKTHHDIDILSDWW
jgi:hypothetical protein